MKASRLNCWFTMVVGCYLASSVAVADLQCLPSDTNFTLVGKFAVPSPAFLTFGSESSNRDSLFISQFFVNPLKEGSVSVVPDLQGSWPNVDSWKATELFDYVWPNLVAPVPETIFQRGNLYTIAGGFLVPGKNTGVVSIFDNSTFPPTVHKISTDVKGHFYHEVLWWDVDQDGLEDLLGARASKPVVGPSTGTLVWWKNPGSFTSGPWDQNELLDGPDVFFRLADFNHDGQPEIVAAEFFSARLMVYACEVRGRCNVTQSWTSAVIDNTIGPLFDVKVTDLNLDGRADLLVTNHVDNATLSGIFAYEVPVPFNTGARWPRHTLAQGFTVRVPGQNQAAPGGTQTFALRPGAKPSILLSGDGAAQAYVLQPASPSAQSWEYVCSVLLATENHGTVGGVAVTDIDRDGSPDLFVPDYDHSLIYVFSKSKEV